MIGKQYRWTIIICLLLALCGGAYYGVLGVINAGKTEVEMNVLPTQAKITVNGKQIGHGSQFIKEGHYTVSLSADGFQSSTKTLDIKKGQENTFFASLIPESSEAQKWVDDHADLYQQQEEKGAHAAQERGEAKRKTFPIVSLLPYTEGDYTIGYRSPKDSELILTIHATDSLNRQLALARIKSWGYSPAEYELEFTDFVYPLDALGEHHD